MRSFITWISTDKIRGYGLVHSGVGPGMSAEKLDDGKFPSSLNAVFLTINMVRLLLCQYGVFLILRPYKSYLQNLQWKLMKQKIYYLVVVVVDTTWLFSFLRTTSFLKNTSAPFVEKYSGILCKFLTINQREEPVENATQII